jgi:MtN3 and saliva related transmembrane protein
MWWVCYAKNKLGGSLMSLTLFLGYFAGFLTTISLVPQVIKMWATKSADDFSLVMLLIWCTGISCWVIYGAMMNSVPIILWNISTLLLAVAILIMKLKFKDKYANKFK